MQSYPHRGGLPMQKSLCLIFGKLYFTLSLLFYSTLYFLLYFTVILKMSFHLSMGIFFHLWGTFIPLVTCFFFFSLSQHCSNITASFCLQYNGQPKYVLKYALLIHLVNHLQIFVSLYSLHIYVYPEGTKMPQMFILLASGLQFELGVIHTQITGSLKR